MAQQTPRPDADQRPRHERANERDDRKPKKDDIKRDDDVVEETSEDSFPASDPPSYSGTTATRDPEDEDDQS